MRAPRILVLAAVVIGLLAGAAVAGGSWIESYRESYRAGETVVMRGNVSPGQLGWIEDGPFYAYLRIDPQAGRGGDRFPYIDESDVLLGELQLRELSSGSVHVSIAFTLPARLPAGQYDVVYCNDPCTEGLGDLIGGWISVVARTSSYGAWPPIFPI